MKKIFCLGIFLWITAPQVWAAQPLKRPLNFVSADSVVVWGDDRSDFRATALAIDPQLQVRPVSVAAINKKQWKRDYEEWTRELLPSLNLSASVADEQGKISVVPTASLVQNAGKMFLQSGNSQFMDVVERAAWNGLMAVAVPGELTFDKHVAAQALINTSSMIYATDEEGVYVNLYINSSTHIKTQHLDFVLDQLTVMPHDGRVKLRMGGLSKGLQRIKIRLRMPDWTFGRFSETYHFALTHTVSQLPQVYVNGREENYPVENGYLVIDRPWNSGDEVYFDFPFQVQYLSPVRQGEICKGMIAFQRGPLVYGFRQPTEGGVFSLQNAAKEDASPNQFGHSQIAVPVTMMDGTSAVYKAEPMMDGAEYLWMNTEESSWSSSQTVK